MYITGLAIPVFPLKSIDIYMDGYYMDKDGNIWSTKGRAGAPTKLMGSSTPSGRYYTLNKRTHRAEDIRRRAVHHGKFALETTPSTSQPAVAPHPCAAALPQGRTKSARAMAEAKGFILATLSPNDRLVFGTDPVFHLTSETAKAEAERIAGITGAEVVMLGVIGKVKVQKAVWE